MSQSKRKGIDMKIWQSFGSEHSANLVIIGRFTRTEDAASALKEIEHMQTKVNDDLAEGRFNPFDFDDRYPDALLDVAKEINLWTLTPNDYASFAYDVQFQLNGNQLVCRTDDEEVLGFIKLLVRRGAKIEVFSAHDHPLPGEEGEEPEESDAESPK